MTNTSNFTYEEKVNYYMEQLQHVTPDSTIYVTGHNSRYLKNGYDETNKNIKALIWEIRAYLEAAIRQGVTKFVTKLSIGIEMWATQLIHALQTSYQDIKLTVDVYLPCTNPDEKWIDRTKETFKKCIEGANRVTYTNNAPFDQKNKQALNNCIDTCIDAADTCLFITNPAFKSPTALRMHAYAKEKNKHITRINPHHFNV